MDMVLDNMINPQTDMANIKSNKMRGMNTIINMVYLYILIIQTLL